MWRTQIIIPKIVKKILPYDGPIIIYTTSNSVFGKKNMIITVFVRPYLVCFYIVKTQNSAAGMKYIQFNMPKKKKKKKFFLILVCSSKQKCMFYGKWSEVAQKIEKIMNYRPTISHYSFWQKMHFCTQRALIFQARFRLSSKKVIYKNSCIQNWGRHLSGPGGAGLKTTNLCTIQET